jgi:hypothetical protein
MRTAFVIVAALSLAATSASAQDAPAFQHGAGSHAFNAPGQDLAKQRADKAKINRNENRGASVGQTGSLP